MRLTNEDKAGLNLALDEATLLGVELDTRTRRAGITLSLLTLPVTGPPPDDSRIQLILYDVARAAASLRLGLWSDPAAPAVSFPPSELLQVVQSFGGCPIYGNDFFDAAEVQLAQWDGRVSFDESFGAPPADPHSIRLFQEGGRDRYLDICIWFGSLEFRHPGGDIVEIREVIEDGKRWWEAFQQNDPRTMGKGLIPLK